MGHCVQRVLLLLRADTWVMFGNAQPLNLVKQRLRALPDAMRHRHQHPTVVVPEPASEAKMVNFSTLPQ